MVVSCRPRLPCTSWRSRCRSCSTRSEDDTSDEGGTCNDDEDRDDDSDNGVDQCDAFDDEEHHLVSLDQQLGVIDHGQA